jgi:hypothetical protein
VVIDSVNSPPTYKSGSSAGWLYNPVTGEFYPNVRSQDVEFMPGDATEISAAEIG